MRSVIKKGFLFFIVLSLFFTFAYAAPPYLQEGRAADGLVILTAGFNPLQQNIDHDFNIHVFNASNGANITDFYDVNCTFHLYNSTGNHVAEGWDTTTSHIFDFEFSVGGGNFSQIGQYALSIGCECDDCANQIIGGQTDITFEVTETGITTAIRAPNYLAIAAFFTIMIITLVYFSRTTKNNHIKNLFSMVSIYMITISVNFGRIIAVDSSMGDNMVNMLRYSYIAMLLVSLFVTVFMVVQYVILWLERMGKSPKIPNLGSGDEFV